MLAARYQSIGDAPVESDDSTFMGGKLSLQMLHGVDNNDKHIFGFGKHQSRISIECGGRKLGRAVVENVRMEYSERQWFYTGYDCLPELPDFVISPMDSCFVDIHVFSCERESKDKPLGVARLPLRNFKDDSLYQCVLKVEADGAESKGTITVGVQFKANAPARALAAGESMQFDPALSGLDLKIKWACKTAESGYDFGVSLVLMDGRGKFLDVVHERRARNSKGLRCELRKSSDVANYDPSVSTGVCLTRFEASIRLGQSARTPKEVKAIYLLVTSGNQMASLSDIDKLTLTAADRETGFEVCKYVVGEGSGLYGGSAARVARFSWLPEGEEGGKVWQVKTLDEGSASGSDYGFLLPDLVSGMSELVEGGCKGGPEDRIILLEPEESFSLADASGPSDFTFTLGLQWDMINDSKMDLDLGCLCMSEELELVESINFENLASGTGGITHGGDAREDTGNEKEDDERIALMMDKLPPEVMFLGFYVNSYDGQPLNDCEKCHAHFFDTETMRDLCMFMIDDGGDNPTFGDKTSVLVCLMYKLDGQWYFKNVGKGADGVTIDQNVAHLKEHITSFNVIEHQREINGKIAGGGQTAEPPTATVEE